MKSEKNTQVIDKKAKDKLTKEILEEINTDVKKDIVEKVVEDVKDMMDLEYKSQLKENISSEIIDDIKGNIRKEQNKLNRRKNFKIVRLYIYIILLCIASILAIYRLYITDNLSILPKNETTKITTMTTTTIIKDLNWYINNYGDLLNNLHFTNFELLKGNYNIKEISLSDKLAMVYKTLATEKIHVEGIIITIDEDDIIEAYKNLFGTIDDYMGTDFDVDFLKFAYSISNKNYISVDKKNINEEYAVNKIIDIKENNDILSIVAYVAIIKDDKIYSVLDLDKAIDDYKMGIDLSFYKDELTQIEYHFKKSEGQYYINAISRK